MTFKEMKELIEKAIAENDDHKYLGLRFENKEREIGEICEKSRHNADRDDDRDFPEFNSDEYENLEQFNGTSAWDLSINNIDRLFKGEWDEWDEEIYFEREHCYVIAGEKVDNHPDRDYDEIIIEDAKIVAKIF